jgi:hypothetical protein
MRTLYFAGFVANPPDAGRYRQLLTILNLSVKEIFHYMNDYYHVAGDFKGRIGKKRKNLCKSDFSKVRNGMMAPNIFATFVSNDN